MGGGPGGDAKMQDGLMAIITMASEFKESKNQSGCRNRESRGDRLVYFEDERTARIPMGPRGPLNLSAGIRYCNKQIE